MLCPFGSEVILENACRGLPTLRVGRSGSARDVNRRVQLASGFEEIHRSHVSALVPDIANAEKNVIRQLPLHKHIPLRHQRQMQMAGERIGQSHRWNERHIRSRQMQRILRRKWVWDSRTCIGIFEVHTVEKILRRKWSVGLLCKGIARCLGVIVTGAAADRRFPIRCCRRKMIMSYLRKVEMSY